MKKLEYHVKSKNGVHARPAANLAQVCTALDSQIIIKYGDKTANANDVLQILGLDICDGAVLEITANGGDEEAALKKVEAVLVENIRESEERISENAEEKPQVKTLKIAFFGRKDYDRIYFKELSKGTGEGTYNCEIQNFGTRFTPETADLAKGFDAICIFVNDECPREAVETLHRLGVRLILLRCAGFNNVDLQAAKECGITVLRVPAYSPYAVAEHAMSILMTANRRLHKAVNRVRENDFALSGLLGVDLHNKVAGIVGTGRIGQCMANICKGYGMTVIGWDAYPNKKLEEEGLLTYVSKEELFERADLISLHAPLIMGEGGTYHMIDAESIGRMKDGVMFVNTARGGLVDNEALIEALRAGKFHAVALDVYEGEDANVYTDHSSDYLSNDITARLLMFPNVVITSHQAFFTREALQAIATVTLENARNFNEGLPLGIAECK